jgi:hypothetical protein
MTYIVGWKFKGNIYLTSDTAITRTLKADNINVTSVGESVYSNANEHINEEAHKLFQIGDDCIIAVTGNIEDAIEFVDNIRKYSVKNDRETYVSDFYKDYYGFDAIIGLISNNIPKLYSLRGNLSDPLKEVKDHICLGSGMNILNKKTESLIKSISKLKLYPTERLAFLVSGHQLFSINTNSLSYGVGGVFNGVRLSTNGVQWNEDISYILYSKDTIYDKRQNIITEESFIVFAFNRETSLYVKSPYPLEDDGINKIIPSCEELYNKELDLEMIAMYSKEFNNQIYNNRKKVKFISFINKSNGEKYKVSLVKLTPKLRKIMYLKYEKNGMFNLYSKIQSLHKLIVIDESKEIECVFLNHII